MKVLKFSLIFSINILFALAVDNGGWVFPGEDDQGGSLSANRPKKHTSLDDINSLRQRSETPGVAGQNDKTEDGHADAEDRNHVDSHQGDSHKSTDPKDSNQQGASDKDDHQDPGGERSAGPEGHHVDASKVSTSRHGLGLGQHSPGMTEGHHGRVKLISWRWEEFRNTILFTLMIFLASLLKVGFHHVPKLSHHFPESCLLIIVGLVTGGIVHFAYDVDDNYFPTFTSDLFFNILLPPIILDAAYAIYDEDFFLNLNAILVFAVIGTIFNIFAVGGMLYVIYACGGMGVVSGISLVQCLIFTSVISAVDPVAVLAIFDEVGVNMVLYFLVFGESLLNDGVSVVVYNTMITLSQQETITADQYVLAVVSFFTVVLGGILIGTLVGILTGLILRLTSRARVLEPLLIICMAYFSYIAAELVHWSGIISLVACGIFQKRYAFINASKKSYTTVKYGIKTLSATSDCIIFIFLGKVAANRFNDLIFNWSFIVSTLVLMTLVRFLGVFVLSWLINRRRTIPINLREQFIMAYGGLRGAVGFSLVYILFNEDPSDVNRMFLTTTLVVVFFTVFVQGGTIQPLVNGLKITRKADRDRSHIITAVNKKTTDHLMAGIESVAGRLSIGSYYKIIEAFDNMYVKKLLLSRKARDRLTLRLEKITLDEHYARLYGPTVLASRQDAVGAVERPSRAAEEESEDGVFFSSTDESVDLRMKKSGVLTDAAVADFRASLNAAFSANTYERYRLNRVSRLSGGGAFEQDVLSQLDNRSRQARHIERRLLFSLGEAAEEDGDGDVEMRPRTRSSVNAARMKRQYVQAKKRFKSIQQ